LKRLALPQGTCVRIAVLAFFFGFLSLKVHSPASIAG
jgi:hypothetical protein